MLWEADDGDDGDDGDDDARVNLLPGQERNRLKILGEEQRNAIYSLLSNALC